MMMVKGKVFDVVKNPPTVGQNNQPRPGYLTVQISGRVNTFNAGVSKAKLFDVAFPLDWEPKLAKFNGSTVLVPVDAYASGKGQLSLRLLEGAEIETVK
jgi:hypothetical protein